MSKITIEELDEVRDFRITHIDESGSLIRFKFKGEKYKLEQIDFYEKDSSLLSDIVLSKYNKDTNSYDVIDRKDTYEDMSSKILDISARRKLHVTCGKTNKNKHQYSRLYNITYTNIDRIYLLKYLTDIDIVDGFFEDIVKLNRKEHLEFCERIQKIKAEIQELEQQRKALETSSIRMGPSNHGSKIYSNKIKAEVSDRNIDKAYKTGDYIKKYNAKIGDTHPEYGGVLTDLRGLKYGTTFNCKNGDWFGVIICNDHGDKTVAVINPFDSIQKENLITEENCCLYIELN